ncbi:hypothetical protein MSG28_016144 [Choristoneura fumiferana]|uniref:Uncharacterized protein n=1 Tax=Choristoneura fumiferana TaxID=7141 RepID=A0ACC0K5Y5_CHOFU|nr:hypothetical protein MSG28_016144 [Choristoneura fumiferana]
MAARVKEENGAESLLACRICLATDAKLFNIREWGLDQVFVDLMGSTLSVCDGFPQHVCVWCRALLLRARELRARCQRAEHLLKDALIHQHYITTSYLRSIDRKFHKLMHTFSHDYSNRNVKFLKHEDKQLDTESGPNSCIFLIESNIENDVKDFDTIVNNVDDCANDDYTHFDDSPEIVHAELEDIVTPQDTPEVNIVESHDQTVKESLNSPQVNAIERIDKTIKKDVNSSKRKLIINKTEKKKRTTKKKGQAWRLKPFCEEEGFKEFEEKYNFKIISLSEEDMGKEMDDRRQTDNYIRSVFKCGLCFKGFLSQSTYNNHMKTHDVGRGAHECRLCRVRFLFPTNLHRHVQNAHRLKYQCCACDTIVRTKASATVHAAFHAGTVFKCDHCDQQFLKVTSRSTHMRMMHPSEIADGGTCTLCGETFISAAGLRAHKTRSHETEPALPTLRCRTCKLRFESQDAIDRHRRAQPAGKCDNKHCSCTKCGEVCANEQDLLTHRMEQHALQLFTCDMCGKTFESKESVATHIDRVHRLIRPPAPARPGFRQKPRRRTRARAPVCEHCGKRVSCMATLRIHMNKHTGERPYRCGVCPKAYMSPYALNVHSETHSVARKWRCEECGATFVHQSSLYQHRKAIHSGERAYQCHICSKTFTQSGSLQTHIKYVHMKIKPPPRKRNKKAAT